MGLLSQHSQNQVVAVMTMSNTVLDASKLMTQKSVGSVVIMDGEKLLGIFTERDLLNRVVSKGLNPQKTLLSQVMSPQVLTTDIKATLESCYEKMQKSRARHLPIVDQGRVVGMVTMRDLLEWLWKEIEEENAHLKRYIQQS